MATDDPPPRLAATDNPSLPNFRLAEKLGQGAFGSVYKALNWSTGETCAVKQIDLSHIPKAELPDIMQEIDLLKNLHHPNIVQYRGYTRTSSSLYIILEYCENGSLSAITKKFGRFPENLVGLYTLQVLHGLLYLHDQGVIHRDIKGSNILATKEGSIKLADFGVATRVGGPSGSAVVGSPYWMAPEVVDQSGATPTSDIWSLGALVVELLTGKPPYHFLDPLPALFRIVNDDAPPIPEGVSAVVRDFLVQCFQKDANLRVGARKLLRHPWMVVAKKQHEEQVQGRERLERGRHGSNFAAGGRAALGSGVERSAGTGTGSGTRPKSVYDDTVEQVQQWNEALKAAPTTTTLRRPPSARPSLLTPFSITPTAPTTTTMLTTTSRRTRVDDENSSHRPNHARRPSEQLASALASDSTPAQGRHESSRLGEPSRLGHAGLPAAIISTSTTLQPKNQRRPPHPTSLTHSSPALPLTAIQPPSDPHHRRRPPFSRGDGLKATMYEVDEAMFDDDDEDEVEKGVADGRGGSGVESDNWDSDFEDGISVSKIVAFDKDGSDLSKDASSSRPESETDPSSTNSNSLTIRPSPRRPPALETSTRTTTANLSLSSRSGPTSIGRRKGQSLDVGLETVLEDSPERPVAAPIFPSSSSSLSSRPRSRSGGHSASSAETGSSSSEGRLSPSETLSVASVSSITTPAMGRFSEEQDEDDYSDLFSTRGSNAHDEGQGIQLESLKLQTRTSSKSWLGDEDSDEEDPFAAETDSPTYNAFSHSNLEANLLRDQIARQCALVDELLGVIVGSGGEIDPDDYDVRDAALQTAGLLEESPEARTQFVKHHGMLVAIEALQVAKSRESLSILLRIVNIIVGCDAATLEKIALVGGCPVVTAFASKRYSREIRLEAALFIGSMCRTSLLTLQMFISCRGLKTLVDMLDDGYEEGKDLVWMAVDGISRVFEMSGPIPRNDFCRILAHEGVLEPLSSALLSVCGDPDDLAESAKAKIVNILLLFAQSDHKVKELMTSRATTLRLMKAAGLLEPDLLAILLKTIKNLSMLPTSLDTLQNASAIELLVRVLGEKRPGRLGAEIENHAVNTLFNLCRLSKARQEEAATAGAIPILRAIVVQDSPLKQFALPILCDFAHAGKTCRKLLWKHDGLRFYLRLLGDTFWVNPALEAVFVWLQDEPAKVEECLLEPDAIESFVGLFCKTKNSVFESMLEPFHRVLRSSNALSSRLATQSGFARRIVERLERASRAVVRLSLLRITKTIFDSLTDRRDKDKIVKIMSPSVSKLAEEDKAVLSRQIAKNLTAEFNAVKEEQRRSLTRRASRRGASEGSIPFSPGLDLASSTLSARADAKSPSISTRRAPIPPDLTSKRR
ncbi:hypothetical protein JCM10212_002126 [Sporobolomyces blumeae]